MAKKLASESEEVAPVAEEVRSVQVDPFEALKAALLGVGEKVNHDATASQLMEIAARVIAPRAFIPDLTHPSGISAVPGSEFDWVYRQKHGAYDKNGEPKHLIHVEQLTDGTYWCSPASYHGESWRAMNNTPAEFSKGVPR